MPWVVGGVVLVVLGWASWVPGLWYDEIVTITMAERSWPSMLSVLTRIDAVHGLYYSIMHMWMDLVAYTPFTLRIPSVVAVAATSVTLVKLGAAQWNLTAGVVAGLVFAAIPRSLWMSTQARSYAFAALAITLAVYLLVVAIKGGARRSWVAYGVALTVAIVVFIYNVLVLPVLVAVVLMQRMPTHQIRRFWTASVIAVATSAPLILMAVNQRGQIGWINRVTLSRAITAPYYAFLDGTSNILAAAAWVVVFATAFLLTLLAIRRAGMPARTLNSGAALVLIGGWASLPMVALLAAGALASLYYDTYLSISVPALALLIGSGVAAIGSKMAHATAVILAVALLAYQPWDFFRQPNSKSDILEAVSLVENRNEAGDYVLFVEGGGWNTRQLSYGYPRVFADMTDLTLDKPFEVSGDFFGTSHPLTEVRQKLTGAERVVVIANKPDSPDSLLTSDSATLVGEGFCVVSEDSTGDWHSTGDWRVLVFSRCLSTP